MEKESAGNKSILEHRAIGIFLSALLFGTNFLLFYFIWQHAFPGITGIVRVGMCWVGAYAFTWMMTYVTKGIARLALALILMAVLFFVLNYKA